MSDAIGGTVNVMLVAIFMVIVSGYMAFNVSYVKAFKVKNEATSIIEKYEGMTTQGLNHIGIYLLNSGYQLKGKCDVGTYGVNINGNLILKLNDKKGENIIIIKN